jgi:nicotinate-nucleotide pyrophosphorylase (carboxylating)
LLSELNSSNKSNPAKLVKILPMRPQQITDQHIHDFIVAGLYEDIHEGDHTCLATIPAESRSRAVLKIKDYGVLAGVEVAQRIFQHVDPSSQMSIHKTDGADVLYGEIAFEVEAQTRALLMAERLVLNTMQRMSGIATLAGRYAFEVSDLKTKILDTRKTTPLIRFLEKWAVTIGGCENYRWGLYDWTITWMQQAVLRRPSSVLWLIKKPMAFNSALRSKSATS